MAAESRLHLGHVIDPATGVRSGADLTIDPRDLTTHAVIVGMTGSGKTGLGVVLLEEALSAGVPALVLDPKGDMTNLALRFPGLAAGDFEPWIDEGDARRAGLTVPQQAEAVATQWREGLAASGVTAERLAAYAERVAVTVYTPGSLAGIPLDIVGSMRAPAAAGDPAGLEGMRDEIEGFVSGLLGLAGIQADPLSSPEHILLANLIEHAWSRGADLDLATLIGQVQAPPLRRLGVFELDTFFPPADRRALAIRLNGLVAAPSFAAWTSGPPLDVAEMLAPRDGRTPCAVLYLAHLSDEERQLVVTLALARVVTWMRGLSGTGDLRALVYIDEVVGMAPPTANPPSKKPLLTILKQARAFGIGMVVATQNPVDLDYKALGNAGTWCMGRLQTERDKARMVEGLTSARGDVDVAALDRALSGLGKRQFLLQSAHRKAPEWFTSRWAMTYLRGPLSREQIARLPQPRVAAGAAASDAPGWRHGPADSGADGDGRAAVARRGRDGDGMPAVALSTAPAPALAADETPAAPPIAEGVGVYWLDPSAPWASEVGARPGSPRHQAALAFRVALRYDDAAAGVDHVEEYEAIAFPLGASFDPGSLRSVDHDARDLRSEPPAGAVYVLDDAPLDRSTYFTAARKALEEELVRRRAIEVPCNRALKLFGRVGETPEEFAARCGAAADDAADGEAAALRGKYEARVRRAEDAARAAEARAEQVAADVAARRQNELLSGAGDLLSAFLGGRRRTGSLVRSIARGSSRRSTTARAEARKEMAEDQARTRAAAVEELEQELAAELEEIEARRPQRAGDVDVVRIPLERSDVRTIDLALVWLPV